MRGDVQIVVEDLVKRFTLRAGSLVALDRISFQVREGEFFCIVGPSACGKTTILRILAGLETKTAGDVAVHYHQSGRPRSAMVFPEQSVFPWMTVEANIATDPEIFAGFLMGAVPALLLGLGLGLSRMVRAFANPIVYALYPIPKVAILPLVMLIFGLGEMSKYVIIAIAVFFLVLVNTMAGVVQIDRIYFDVARNFNASRRDFYLNVVLQGALPSIFTGLKLALGVAPIVLVTAEFVGARSGIGVMIYESWQVFAIERLFVGLVVVSFLGYVLSLPFNELERLVMLWQRDRR